MPPTKRSTKRTTNHKKINKKYKQFQYGGSGSQEVMNYVTLKGIYKAKTAAAQHYMEKLKLEEARVLSTEKWETDTIELLKYWMKGVIITLCMMILDHGPGDICDDPELRVGNGVSSASWDAAIGGPDHGPTKTRAKTSAFTAAADAAWAKIGVDPPQEGAQTGGASHEQREQWRLGYHPEFPDWGQTYSSQKERDEARAAKSRKQRGAAEKAAAEKAAAEKAEKAGALEAESQAKAALEAESQAKVETGIRNLQRTAASLDYWGISLDLNDYKKTMEAVPNLFMDLKDKNVLISDISWKKSTKKIPTTHNQKQYEQLNKLHTSLVDFPDNRSYRWDPSYLSDLVADLR
jgi:hypothetical protein